jgi:Ca-activated chloride channel family protein
MSRRLFPEDLTARTQRATLCPMLRTLLLAAAMPFGAAQSCETALILSMDVSNSVDAGEYRLQVEGLAMALSDPEIAEILVRDNVALSVIQWSGADHQTVSLDWVQMRSTLHVQSLAQKLRSLERAFVLSDTAPAEALAFALGHFAKAPSCKRRGIDVSGDGTPNAGGETRHMRQRAERAGVTVNALAIEGMGLAISNFYRQQLITRDGFVQMARGHRDFARAIREKILREISQIMG